MAFKDLFRKKSVDLILQQSKTGYGDAEHTPLAKHLGVRDLTAFGIAAIIGAGIFSTIGTASADGGPGVIFLFIFTALACGFAAFAYAEFASMVPVSGSAYTYSYVAFGELIAWIIGWALIMEYGVGNITVAVSWSDYFTGLLDSIRIGSINGIHVPEWASIDYVSASSGFKEASTAIAGGAQLSDLPQGLQTAYLAWTNCPTLGGFHIIADIPAILIIVFITWLVFIGIKETRNASNAMVVIKLAVVLLVIAVGIFHVDAANWDPFMPNGVPGVLKGVSSVFFAYIGFDAISTTAEECKNPERDLPKGIMNAIIICTILYILIALVLTGMVNYSELAVGDPLAYVFHKLDMKWFSGVIAVSAVVAMASVLLVFQMGQPRIWMSMSRDGLLPKKFAKVHPRYKTPSFSTIVTGFVVAVPTLFIPSHMVLDLCSMGTLFAFVLVCGGVLMLQNRTDIPRGKFRTPYINSQLIMPAFAVLAIALVFSFSKETALDFIQNKKQPYDVETFMRKLNDQERSTFGTFIQKDSLDTGSIDPAEYLSLMNDSTYTAFLEKLPIDDSKKFNSGLNLFLKKIPMWLFLLLCAGITYLSFAKKLSLIPVLGLVFCFYMMAQIPSYSWLGFLIWLVIGLVIYFGYSRKNSKLNTIKS